MQLSLQVFVRASPKEGMDADSAASSTATNQTGQVAAAPQGSYKYFFNIGSVDSFEAKMMEAQEQLGWDSDQGVLMTICTLPLGLTPHPCALLSVTYCCK